MIGLITKGVLQYFKTNYLPNGGNLKINITDSLTVNLRETLKIYIQGSCMSLNENLRKWFEGDSVSWSDTITGLSGDPTDYTIKFEISQNGTIKQTLTGSIDAESTYSISDTLSAAITAGDYIVYVSIWWNDGTEKSDYDDWFSKTVYERPTA